MSSENPRSAQIFENETIHRYSEIAEVYDSDWRGRNDEDQLAYLERFQSILGEPPKTILDVGCGTGKDSLYFASRQNRVVSLDLSPDMLSLILKKAKEQDLEIEPLRSNMKQIALDDESVNGIWNMASLVHIAPEDRKDVFSEFYRVLKPGGIVHIGVQNLLAPKHIKRLTQSLFFNLGYDEDNQFYIVPKKLKDLKNKPHFFERLQKGYAFLDGRHWFYPTKQELIRLIKQQGFSIISSNNVFSQHLRITAQK